MVDIRPITENDLDAFIDVMDVAYLQDSDKNRRDRYRRLVALDRCIAAFDGDQLVGTISAHSFDLTVPGNRTISMDGTTAVAVRPTHRRRGILRHMIAAHLDDVRQHGKPVAGLWASEASIYGRFGFGCAIEFAAFDINADMAIIDGPIDDNIRIRMIDKPLFSKVAPRLYDAMRTSRPGALSRTSTWWQSRRLAESSAQGSHISGYRYAQAERAGEVVGYVQYRTKEMTRDGVADGEVYVAELLGLDVDTELALWQFLFGIDLTTTVKAPFRSMGDPLLYRLIDRRAIKIFMNDGLHLRFTDVPAALAGRAYDMPGGLTIDLTDQADIQGTYRLEVEADGVTRCIRTEDPADIRLDARSLAAAYMAGCRIGTLARAGRVSGSSQAIRLADLMFGSRQDPIAGETF